MRIKFAEIMIEGEWTPIMISKLKNGDVFRLYNGPEMIMNEKGSYEFIARSDSYVHNDEWVVDCEANQ